jgi:hypothetical protein
MDSSMDDTVREAKGITGRAIIREARLAARRAGECVINPREESYLTVALTGK